MNLLRLLAIGLAIFIAGGCAQETTTNNNNSNIQIVTTISQIGEPIQAIVGEHANVISLMGPGTDPHLYEATQSDIVALQNANVIFYNGHYLEGNMGAIFKEMNEIKPTYAIAESIEETKLLMDDGAIDPHVWFDVPLWKESLEFAVHKLIEHYPDKEAAFKAGMANYFKELDELEKYAIKKINEIPEQSRVLVTAHDAFGYFGRMNNIEVVGLQGLSTEDEVSITDIQATIDILVEKQVPAVFVESSVNDSAIRSVIEGAKALGLNVQLGGELYSDAMGEENTEAGTYIGMYRHNIDTIHAALTQRE